MICSLNESWKGCIVCYVPAGVLACNKGEAGVLRGGSQPDAQDLESEWHRNEFTQVCGSYPSLMLIQTRPQSI